MNHPHQKKKYFRRKKILTKSNPNITFIRVQLEEKKILAFIDTGAGLCFGKETISQDWVKIDKPIKIIVADKSVHRIEYAVKNKILVIEEKKFPIPTIYLHDSGLDMIIGNNFLKLYNPFCQYLDYISLKCPRLGGQGSEVIKTKIITKFEVLKLHLENFRVILEEQKFLYASIEDKLLEVC